MESAKKKSSTTMQERSNTLRAGVLGANDGILTVVGVLVSVAAASSNQFTIFIAGLSDLLACAFSMACGEFSSVSTQKDTEKAAVEKEKELLKTNFEDEVKAVRNYYVNKGVSQKTSDAIARDLLQKDALATVVRVKYSLQLGHYFNPWHAAFSSLISAASGGIFPLFAMTFAPVGFKWQATIGAVILSSALTGYLSAKLGNGLTKVAVVRNIVIALITVTIHFGVGKLF